MSIYLKSINNNFKIEFKLSILSPVDLIYDEYVGEINLDKDHFGYNGSIPLILTNIHGTDILNYIIYYESVCLNIILSISGITNPTELSLKINNNNIISNLSVNNDDKICEIKFCDNSIHFINDKVTEYFITCFPTIIHPKSSIKNLTIKDKNNKIIDYYII